MCEQIKNKISVIGDIDKICRTCLCKAEENSVQFESVYFENKIEDIYSNITSIKVNKDDLLPKKVCTTCYDQIIKFYVFKTEAIRSEEVLIKAFLEKEDLNEIEDKVSTRLQNGESHDVTGLVDTSSDYLEDAGPVINSTIESNSSILGNSEPKQFFKESVKEETKNEDALVLQCEKSETFVKSRNRNASRKVRRKTESCKQCGKVLLSYKMQSHIRTHTKEKPFACEECGACFSEKSNLARHIKTHLSERPHRCEICNKGFLRPSSLKMHKNAHSNERNVLCPACGKAFKHRHFLNKHMITMHNKPNTKEGVEDPVYSCSICGNLYKTKSSLQVHRSKHSQPNAFLCNVCGKRYSTKAILENHQRIHSGEKAFTCTICQKTFMFITTLKTHMLVHSGEKPLTCHVCNKQFRQHSHLNTHIRGQHSKERPYKCTFCSKAFKYNSNLVVHTRTHTGETPHHCDICQKGFYDSSSLKKHKKVHNMEKTVYFN